MGGPATWALVESTGELIARRRVGGGFGASERLASPPTILSDDGRMIHVTFGQTGVEFHVDRNAPYVYEDAYIYEQGIANSRHFPREFIPELRASLVGIPPIVVLQKIGVLDGFPSIENTESFQDLQVRITAGDCDPAHTLEIESKTKDLLASWGARQDHMAARHRHQRQRSFRLRRDEQRSGPRGRAPRHRRACGIDRARTRRARRAIRVSPSPAPLAQPGNGAECLSSLRSAVNTTQRSEVTWRMVSNKEVRGRVPLVPKVVAIVAACGDRGRNHGQRLQFERREQPDCGSRRECEQGADHGPEGRAVLPRPPK